MRKKIDPALRQEINTVLIHQESLMQQYRTLLYTIQSLLFGTFMAVYVGLGSAQLNKGQTGYCLSSLKGPPFFEFVVFCILIIIVAVGPLILFRTMNVIIRRGKLVTYCQHLLMLDELGMLEDVWSKCVRSKDGTPAGIQVTLQMLEGHYFVSPDVRGLLGECQFDALRLRLEAVALSASTPSARDLFNNKLPLYVYGLWFAAAVALFFYASGMVTC